MNDYMTRKDFVKKTLFALILAIEVLIIVTLYSRYSNITYTGKFLTYPWEFKINSDQDPYWNLTFLSSWFNESVESEKFFKYLFIRSDHSELIWELIPNQMTDITNTLDDWSLKDVDVNINSLGYRGRQIDYDAKANERRVVVIGDSHSFGWGVEDNETFPFFLEALLNEKYEEVDWDVINLGVPGYDLNQKISMLKIMGLKYDPDIVIVQGDRDDIFPPLLRMYLYYRSYDIRNPQDTEVFQSNAMDIFLRKNNITEIEEMQIIEPMNRLKELEKNNISQIIFLGYYSIRNNLIRDKCKSFGWSYVSIDDILDKLHTFAISKYEPHLNSTAQKMVSESLLNLIDIDRYE